MQQLQKFTGYIGTQRDVPELREKMHQVQAQTRTVIADTGASLKRLGQFDGGSPMEARERRMQQEKLSKDFKSVLQKFQTSSQVAISKERETVVRARAASVKAGQGGDGGEWSGSYGGSAHDEQQSLIEAEQKRQMGMMDE